MNTFDINVLVYEEGGKFVAHAMELDICDVADTKEVACKYLMELCCIQIEAAFRDDNLEYLFRSPTMEIWQKYISFPENTVVLSVPFDGRIAFKK